MRNRSGLFSGTWHKILLSACFMVLIILFTVRPVKAASPKITLDRTVFTVKKGKSIRLHATVLKKKFSKRKIIWSSSRKSVATVSAKGVVRARKKGKTTITARIKGTGFKARCKLTVGVPVRKIQVEYPEIILFAGEKNRIPAQAVPLTATSSKLEYTSSDPEIVTVIGDGYLTAVAPGEAEVTVKSTDGTEVSSLVKVTVNDIIDIGFSSGQISDNTRRLMTLMNKYSSFIKEYGSLCYKNGSSPTLTYEAAKAKADAGERIALNCASPANWALVELGFMPKGQIYGTKNGFVITNSASRTVIQTQADFINQGEAMGLCVQDASDKGALLYGDILAISINGTNHTVVYAGRSETGHALVYEAGGIAQSTGYSTCGCGPLDYSKSSYSKYAITEIIRFR